MSRILEYTYKNLAHPIIKKILIQTNVQTVKNWDQDLIIQLQHR
jgi:hypothetical protein